MTIKILEVKNYLQHVQWCIQQIELKDLGAFILGTPVLPAQAIQNISIER